VSFEKRKAVPLAAAFLIAVGIGSTATADTGVEIYSTNVTLNGGDIGLGGGDIRDSGVVVWNSSQGFVPAASVETSPIQSGTTASDVGLGQVENEAQVAESGDTLSGTLNLGGNNLTSSGTTVYDSANGFVPAASVEVNPIQSGTTSSDVGLGQVENEAQVAESGDKMTGALNMNGNTIDSVATPTDSDDAAPRSWINDNDDFQQDTNADTECSGSDTFLSGSGTCEPDNFESDTNDGYLPDDPPSSDVDMSGQDLDNVENLDVNDLSTHDTNEIDVFDDVVMDSNDDIEGDEGNRLDMGPGNIKLETTADGFEQITLDADGGSQVTLRAAGEVCSLNSNDFSCSVAKNWIFSLNNTHSAYYSSQESPEVRAVYEGQAATSNGRVNVSLPSHFSKTVSDTRPSLRVQATPHSLSSVAVTERTDDYLVVESSKDVTVDYRVTGIREGYEDKQVVRKK